MNVVQCLYWMVIEGCSVFTLNGDRKCPYGWMSFSVYTEHGDRKLFSIYTACMVIETGWSKVVQYCLLNSDQKWFNIYTEWWSKEVEMIVNGDTKDVVGDRKFFSIYAEWWSTVVQYLDLPIVIELISVLILNGYRKLLHWYWILTRNSSLCLLNGDRKLFSIYTESWS